MTSGLADTRFAGARMPGALSLPRLGASVPRKIVPGRLGAANAAITRFLLDAKAFGEADVPASFDDSLRACEQALSRWIARQIGPLRCLRPAFHMQVLDGQGNTIDLYRGGDRGALPSYGGIEISWGEAGVHEWPVGQRLQELEDACPGLGATVLHVLHRQSLHCLSAVHARRSLRRGVLGLLVRRGGRGYGAGHAVRRGRGRARGRSCRDGDPRSARRCLPRLVKEVAGATSS